MTLVTDEETDFWNATSGQSLKALDNPEDDVYASFSKNDIVLIRYPFFGNGRHPNYRPAVTLSNPHISDDYLVAPLTSKIGIFRRRIYSANWTSAG